MEKEKKSKPYSAKKLLLEQFKNELPSDPSLWGNLEFTEALKYAEPSSPNPLEVIDLTASQKLRPPSAPYLDITDLLAELEEFNPSSFDN